MIERAIIYIFVFGFGALIALIGRAKLQDGQKVVLKDDILKEVSETVINIPEGTLGVAKSIDGNWVFVDLRGMFNRMSLWFRRQDIRPV
ncbi:MAG: hypothetical protein ACOC32_02290 [Nanoarchaeota archaeon]